MTCSCIEEEEDTVEEVTEDEEEDEEDEEEDDPEYAPGQAGYDYALNRWRDENGRFTCPK